MNAPAPARPKYQDLERLAPSDWVVRLISPSHFNGEEVASANLRTAEWKGKPNEKDYGPSIWAVKKLVDGLAELEAVNPKWETFGVALLRVEELEAFGVEVRLSPQDCAAFPAIAHAHASIIGIKDEQTRDDVIDVLNTRLKRGKNAPRGTAHEEIARALPATVGARDAASEVNDVRPSVDDVPLAAAAPSTVIGEDRRDEAAEPPEEGRAIDGVVVDRARTDSRARPSRSLRTVRIAVLVFTVLCASLALASSSARCGRREGRLETVCFPLAYRV